jgi:hypothetical protein
MSSLHFLKSMREQRWEKIRAIAEDKWVNAQIKIQHTEDPIEIAIYQERLYWTRMILGKDKV